MMKRLRGRNLAHPGCLIGVTAGLALGIMLAGILAIAFNTPYNTVLLVWFGMTVGLGAIGWLVGSVLTSRFPARPGDAAYEQGAVASTGDADALPTVPPVPSLRREAEE
jgi:hypothetical protein